ncbi:MAG: sigma-70 family RNA polymerase sigma factor [Thermoanaerobaculia bacterium]|nr:sigma-70 family RNA polymerase sigma factor [Thermoanaerobaculia bacterium]
MTEAAARQADPDPVAAVYDAYRGFLVALVCQKFRVPDDDALGLVHEVFLSFLRCRRDIENQRAWLIAAACNAARGYWRQHRDDDDPATALESIGRSGDAEVLVRVAEVLRRLPERSRRVLELHYLEGHSTREIATILNTTQGFAEKLVHQSLVQARAAAGEERCT